MTRRVLRRAGLGAVLALGAATPFAVAEPAGAALPASPIAATYVSGNWAGYAVTRSSRSGFASVSATWVQPAATCVGRAAYSSFWVGMGGFAQGSNALEQLGTEADCTASGRAVYSAWYEMVPAAPVTMRLRIRAGDTISARVSVHGKKTTVTLHDMTAGARFIRTLRVPRPDVSSAEWIVEAPSACTDSGSCLSLPLANFGSAAFSGVSATGRGDSTGAVSRAGWSTHPIALRQRADGLQGAAPPGAEAASAAPSPLSPDGSAFSVTWQAGALPAPAPSPGTPVPQRGKLGADARGRAL